MERDVLRFISVAPYLNRKSNSRVDFWKDRQAVEKIVKDSPLSPEDIELQVNSIIHSVHLILTGVLAENYLITIGTGDTLLMEPHITPEDKLLLEENLNFLEQWKKSKMSLPLSPTIH